MKNKFAMAIGGMIAATILGLGFSQSGNVQAGPSLSQEDIRSQLEKQYPGEITEMELDKEAKNPIYEVEIDIEGKEYELAMDGNSGKVLHLFEKTEQRRNNAKEENIDTDKDATKQEEGELTFIEKPVMNTATEEAKSVKPDPKAVIGGSKAKSIALAQLSGNIVELELDHDDGRAIYEIEIEKGNNEAELELDAYTGEILVIEIDTEDDDD